MIRLGQQWLWEDWCVIEQWERSRSVGNASVTFCTPPETVWFFRLTWRHPRCCFYDEWVWFIYALWANYSGRTSIACFSPSVPRHFRVLWGQSTFLGSLYTRCSARDKSQTVQNQGMLTHSAQDFFKADYFFCDGLKDDWLEKCVSDLAQLNNTRLISRVNRLIAKGLIVRALIVRINFILKCLVLVLGRFTTPYGSQAAYRTVFWCLFPNTYWTVSPYSLYFTVMYSDRYLFHVQTCLTPTASTKTRFLTPRCVLTRTPNHYLHALLHLHQVFPDVATRNTLLNRVLLLTHTPENDPESATGQNTKPLP